MKVSTLIEQLKLLDQNKTIEFVYYQPEEGGGYTESRVCDITEYSDIVKIRID